MFLPAKFSESLRRLSSYIRDEIDGLLAYLDELFGEENMNECKDYLKMLKSLYNLQNKGELCLPFS